MKEKFILRVDSINKNLDKLSNSDLDMYIFFIDNLINELVNVIDRCFFIKKNKFEKYCENKKRYLSNIFKDTKGIDENKINPNIYESIQPKFKQNKFPIILNILEIIEEWVNTKYFLCTKNEYKEQQYNRSLLHFDLDPTFKYLFDLQLIKHMYKIKRVDLPKKYDYFFKIIRDQYTDFKNQRVLSKYYKEFYRNTTKYH